MPELTLTAPTVPVSTLERTLALLDVLGDTPEIIAKTLFVSNIRGIAEDADYCPVANYLRRTLPYVTGVSVNICDIDIMIEREPGCRPEYIEILTPLPVAQFIRMFDSGGFPDLAVAKNDVETRSEK